MLSVSVGRGEALRFPAAHCGVPASWRKLELVLVHLSVTAAVVGAADHLPGTHSDTLALAQ